MELKCWKALLPMAFGMLLIVLNGIEMDFFGFSRAANTCF